MVQPPAGTVTFLFTDIERSTRLWEERPDEMRTALAEHDAALRAAIESHGGYVFATGGDGFAAAFGRAADAVAAAEQAQSALAGVELLRARMGINTGEAHERDGDYFGPVLNRTARLMAAGHGGQVLLSAVTADLVPGLVLRNLGEHRLRDLGSPMVIWQLGTGDFPPLRTLDVLPGNLPGQRTSFIGRADEVKELAALVGAERLVTLTGPGGVGKSRLALQVAADVAPDFNAGAWFASLASLEEGALTAATILEALGVPERRDESAVDTLCAWATGREALLVIDNCEHLLAEVATVVDRLLEASATVSVLATSQAPLGVRGEHVCTVAPLAGGGGARDGIELFVDRARMARADFALTDDNEAAVAEICERLDHVPLAIELAAARVRGMTPHDIARRLDQRLRLLATGDRLAPGRHRTLDAAVRWSYELLDDAQRRVFDRCSVFAGPFTIEAAEAIVAGDGVDEWEVLDGVLALVDKSLVLAEERGTDTRYRLLETMRQFGYANLGADGLDVEYRRRHADYYADYVLSRRHRVHGSGDAAARDEIDREPENIRVALRHAADDHGSARFEELFITLYSIWLSHAMTEGTAWTDELMRRPVVDARARITALGCGAQLMTNVSLATLAEVVAQAEALSATIGAAPAHLAVATLAIRAVMQGQPDVAIAECDRAILLMADEPDGYLRAQTLGNCVAVLAICGDFERLTAASRELEELADRLDNRYIQALTASSLAPAVHLIDPDRAGEVLRRGYDLHEELGNFQPNISNAMFLALHEVRQGDQVAAARWARQALRLAIASGRAFIAQVVDAALAIVRRGSATDAAVLLGALRAHRAREQQVGTPGEIETEARFEASLRRRLGDEFDGLYARGQSFDEAAMVEFAFAQLDAIEATAGDTPE